VRGFRAGLRASPRAPGSRAGQLGPSEGVWEFWCQFWCQLGLRFGARRCGGVRTPRRERGCGIKRFACSSVLVQNDAEGLAGILSPQRLPFRHPGDWHYKSNQHDVVTATRHEWRWPRRSGAMYRPRPVEAGPRATGTRAHRIDKVVPPTIRGFPVCAENVADDFMADNREGQMNAARNVKVRFAILVTIHAGVTLYVRAAAG
jgi:hypothetical protein